jgi:hypothetical protein
MSDNVPFESYLTGFTVSRGSFHLDFREEDKSGTAAFALRILGDERPIMGQIRDYLGCGRIHYRRYGYGRSGSRSLSCFIVRRVADLRRVIVPFFERNPLIGRKHEYFVIWKEGVDLLGRIEDRSSSPEWTTSDRVAFLALKAALKDQLRMYAPPISPDARSAMGLIQRELSDEDPPSPFDPRTR